MESSHEHNVHTVKNTEEKDQFKSFYPMVDEEQTPLPRKWNFPRRLMAIRVVPLQDDDNQIYYESYNGRFGSSFRVCTSHQIPDACGIYYFEIKIIKTIDSECNITIGLTAKGDYIEKVYQDCTKVFYGYNGKDGHKVLLKKNYPTSEKYAKTFSQGDVVGCGVNLVDKTVFYTVNGTDLGLAFPIKFKTLKDHLRVDLYPTVEFEVPGEVISTNFGKSPFVFDIETMIKEMRNKTSLSISSYPNVIPPNVLHKMVLSYLMYHGYCDTAESLINATPGNYSEIDLSLVQNKKQILKHVSLGQIREAIELTNQLYPNLLEKNGDLLFALKCREFVEMIDKANLDFYSNADNQTSVIKLTKSAVETEPDMNHVAKKRKISENGNDENATQNNFLSSTVINQLIDFGKELNTQRLELEKKHGKSKINEKMLQDACSLLLYSDPRNSPVSWLLEPKARQTAFARLNAAITNVDHANSLIELPVLDVASSHLRVLIKLMSKFHLAEYGFATLDNIIPPVVNLPA